MNKTKTFICALTLALGLGASTSAFAGGGTQLQFPSTKTPMAKPLKAAAIARLTAKMVDRGNKWAASQGLQNTHVTVDFSQRFVGSFATAVVSDASGKELGYAQYSVTKRRVEGTSVDNSPSNRPYIEYIRIDR